MLKFYGIRFNKQGTPERFTMNFALRESLNAGLHIFDHTQRDVDQSLKAIDGEINKMYQGSEAKNRCSGPFRLTVAKWFRTRDIVRFVCQHKSLRRYKLAIARCLNTPQPITEKWARIQRILITRLSGLEEEERQEELGNPESDLNLTLQMIGLFFLEQDDEMPPANLELQFIRGQFPKIIWKKKDGFSAASNPFWLPKNPHCRVSYLASRVVSRMSSLTGAQLPTISSAENVEQNTPAISNTERVEVSLDSLLPEELPDELRLEFEGDDSRRSQLTFLPETAAETLLSLQKMIQKRFWHDGVKHLMAIFRQIAERSAAGLCEFDTDTHFQLISRSKRNGTWSEKQQTVLKGVLSTLFQLRVKRLWKNGDHPRETSNPFIAELCSEFHPERSCFPVRKLLLDPIFCPGQNNPFRLGGHLMLIPNALFQESIYKHALLPGIASFVSGVWLNEFPTEKGVLEKTTKEMIEGGAFNVTPANKYRLLRKLKSELVYMEEKCYITRYSVLEDKSGNPWNDRHRFSAPETTMAAISESFKINQANPYPERLIA